VTTVPTGNVKLHHVGAALRPDVVELHVPRGHGRHRHHRPGGRSRAGVPQVAAVLRYALLLVAWLAVAARTVSGAASGRLFRPVAAIARASST